MSCDIAIVGGGPVGTLLANLLGQRGLSVHLVEKRHQPYDLPRAIHFDGEAMRVFQSVGLADVIEPKTFVGRGMLFKNLAGETLIDWSRAQTPGPMGWYESYRFHQPDLEADLRRGLARFSNVTMTSGQAVVAVGQADDGVMLTLDDDQMLTARVAVGCDGAQSFLRTSLDMGWTDLGFQERWLVVDASLRQPRPDLGDYSIQYCHPDTPATYVRGIENRRRWECRLSETDPDVPDASWVWHRLAQWISPEDADLERAAVYVFRSGVATNWRCGRVLLAGDAAHQMPPFMGQGMCAGVRDAANLAWKLAAVLLHGADQAVLDTYQTEREHNVRTFIDKSVALGRLINQTAPQELPRGRMASIWPDLGPGLGARDGTGGALVPQGRTDQGALADDAAFPGFHILAVQLRNDLQLPCFAGDADWLDKRGLVGVVVRPDGYALAGLRRWSDLAAVLADMPVAGQVRR